MWPNTYVRHPAVLWVLVGIPRPRRFNYIKSIFGSFPAQCIFWRHMHRDLSSTSVYKLPVLRDHVTYSKFERAVNTYSSAAFTTFVGISAVLSEVPPSLSRSVIWLYDQVEWFVWILSMRHDGAVFFGPFDALSIIVSPVRKTEVWQILVSYSSVPCFLAVKSRLEPRNSLQTQQQQRAFGWITWIVFLRWCICCWLDHTSIETHLIALIRFVIIRGLICVVHV